ncbi:MAG: PilC/PilY family type IV pilus protein [Sulfuriferula sp.]|nr:PilC/PilY family type IV pilus protein [Sulfuriferula sp.]
MDTPKMMPVASLAVLLTLLIANSTFASTVTDDFTQATDSSNWKALNYACLTAGTSSNNSTSNSNIPGCNYTTPDTVGSGALRLTPASGNQTGAIISNFTFPSNQGLQVTFTTYTYGGDSGGPGHEGADGMSFFLTDGSQPTPTVTGGLGGSLGYSCSNVNSVYNGLVGAYIGLGMDEYGNFLNGGSSNDNTATGIPIQTSSSSTNGYNSFTSGSYQQANRIGLRGTGNVNWTWLNKNYPNYYPASLSSSSKQTAVQQTCKTGTLWNYGAGQPQVITALTNSGKVLTVTVPNHGFSNGDTVLIGGTISDVAPAAKAITGLSSSSKTLTVTVPNHGFSNGDSVTLGGTINDASAAQSITAVSTSSKTVTLTVSNTFKTGDIVKIAGVSDTKNVFIPGSYTIATASSTKITINLSSTPGTITLSSATAVDTSPVIPGTYTISGVTTNTFTVTLSATPWTITNISGTAALATVPTISGSYTISGVTANTFNVTLSTTPGIITNTSGTASDSSQSTSPYNSNTAVSDFAPIPGGYWVLPASQLMAKESATSRTQAWPITYKLIITSNNLLTFMYSYNGGSYQTVLTNQSLSASNGALPSSFRFGFSGSTGGSNNVHEITCFVAQPVQSASSAGANTIEAGQVQTGTQIYLAGYNPNNWWGTLASYPLVLSAGTLTASTVANWDGSCVLTGGGCSAMGTDSSGNPLNTIAVESPTSRQLLTWNGSGGAPLEWSNLTSSQQAILNTNSSGSNDGNGAIRLNWLRGDRTNEQTATPAGPLRTRDSVLGDIIDSSPTWVGGPSMNYASPFNDAIYGGTGAPENGSSAQAYSSYTSSYATRTNVVYSGSNDGLLHGFRTGSYNSDGTYNKTNNDGQEVIGFMPSGVLANSNVVSLTSPTYGHNYFVNASPGIGDLFYANAWHTWLVGGVGAGGAEIYALDITDPTKFSETNASTLVKGDWTDSVLSNLGNTYGTPIIRRLHNGQWAIIFGNGFGNTIYHAGVYIGLVNSTTGTVTYKWLDTGVGSSSNPDGIAYVSSADLDGDHVADYLYAGDLLGNVWRFDLTSSNPADWGVSKFGQTTATPLFTSGSAQPITSSIAVAAANIGGAERVILMFGTGQKIPSTTSAPDTYATGTQTVYGIWDYDMHNWNNGATTTNSVTIPASSVKYAELTAPQSINRSNLLAQVVASVSAGASSSAILGYRSISSTNNVCWQGSSACGTGNSQYGWYFDLPDTNEQVVYNPAIVSGALVVNTTIPPTSAVGQCSLQTPTGWTMAFNVASGGGLPQNFFPDSTGAYAASDGNSVMGIKMNGVGSPWVVSVGTTPYIVTQTVSGEAQITQVNPQNGITVKRITWEELR